MERENSKGILFGVLGVMTLVIAILGASLAYFTAVDRSDENAVQVQAATVTITYVQGQVLQASDLIPATQTVVETAYAKSGEEQCIDAKGQKVCSVFRFEAKNSGEKNLDITGRILTTTQLSENGGEDGLQTREFDNLSYVVYDTTTGEAAKVTTEKGTFAKFGGSTQLFVNGSENNTVTVTSGASNKYEVLIWLNEVATPEQLADPNNLIEGSQNHEQGLKYAGTVEIAVHGASDKITGQ